MALLLTAILLLALVFVLGRWSKKAPAVEVVKETRDTLYLRDTLEVEVAAAPCYIYHRDTVLLPVLDTITRQDTIYAAVERTAVRYEDSSYTAVVSGVEPRLDSLTIYPQREIVTIHTKERLQASRWSFGVQAGAGILYDGTFHAGPYIGVGVAFRF